MFDTWYKMLAIIEEGLDLSPIITHRFPASDFEQGFTVMRGGQSGKVILDWEKPSTDAPAKPNAQSAI